jgi:hypothetical protein
MIEKYVLTEREYHAKLKDIRMEVQTRRESVNLIDVIYSNFPNLQEGEVSVDEKSGYRPSLLGVMRDLAEGVGL